MQKNKKILICVSIGFLIAIIFAVMPSSGSDRIYSNIYIHNVPVGGLNAAEASAALMEHFQSSFAEETIKYTINGELVSEFAFEGFGASLNFTEPIQIALDYGTLQNLPRRIGRMFGRQYNISHPASLEIIPAKLESVLSGLARQVDRAAQNATFALEGSDIVIKPERAGYGVDIQATIQATIEQLESFNSGTIELTLQTIEPTHKKSDFDFPISVLGVFKTNFIGNETDPRIYNIALASDRIHNQVLHSDEVFSAGSLIGAHLPNSGYKAAIVLVNGEPVEDIGGGVCQVVSTLYNAVLFAELPIMQRHNHSAIVSYVDYGFDATVAGDYYDLKFKNPTPHPILITSQMRGGELILTIHGYESRPPERSIRFSTTRTELDSSQPYREIVDASVPRGERYIILESQAGYQVELLKHVYMHGREVEVIQMNTSTYKPLQGVIAVGAG